MFFQGDTPAGGVFIQVVGYADLSMCFLLFFLGAAMFRDGADHHTRAHQNTAGEVHVDDNGIVRQGELAL